MGAGAVLGTVVLFTILAVLVESLVERFGAQLPSWGKPWLAAVLGVVLCVAYDADILAYLGLQSTWPFIGQILTGLLISRGANYINAWTKAIGQGGGQTWLVEELTSGATPAPAAPPVPTSTEDLAASLRRAVVLKESGRQ